jgi:hypothetical protein
LCGVFWYRVSRTICPGAGLELRPSWSLPPE